MTRYMAPAYIHLNKAKSTFTMGWSQGSLRGNIDSKPYRITDNSLMEITCIDAALISGNNNNQLP